MAARVAGVLADYHQRSSDGDAAAVRTGAPARRPSTWDRLVARVPVRLDPGRRGALAVGVAVAVAALLTGLWLVSERPRALAVAPSASASVGSPLTGTGIASPRPSAASASPVLVVVDVSGRVRHPGLYRLPAGSRVDDAVRAAGGALHLADLNRLNLAARLVDGQQVPVGIAGAGGPAPAGSGGAGAPASGPVDLNTATLDQLETLPGVGPVTAQHILDWRSAHGSFTSIDQLQDVSGIGPAKFAAVRGSVTV